VVDKPTGSTLSHHQAGAAFVFNVGRREDVEEFVRADPYYEHGLVTHYSIKEWHLTV
jgi:uncharacterized protein YciI